MKLTIRGMLKAEESPFLNSARNGTTRARDRKRRPLRLPQEFWERLDGLAEELRRSFPAASISTNSTIEFLLQEGLSQITSSSEEE